MKVFPCWIRQNIWLLSCASNPGQHLCSITPPLEEYFLSLAAGVLLVLLTLSILVQLHSCCLPAFASVGF